MFVATKTKRSFRILLSFALMDSLGAAELARLVASDAAGKDEFGYSAAVSGTTAVLGAHGKANRIGAAYVFVRSGGQWMQQARLTASDGSPNSDFGYALSVDGDTVVIGAPFKTIGGNNQQGAAYVFVRSGASWIQQTRLTPSDGTSGSTYCGATVALSGDTAVVGCENETVGSKNSQSVAHVFARKDSTWTEQARLSPTDSAANDSFVHSLSASGDRVLVGENGAAYVFVRNASTWSQEAKLNANDSTVGIGAAVALNGDTAAVLAPAVQNALGAPTGAAYVFVRTGNGWVQQAKLAVVEGGVGIGLDRSPSSTSISLNANTVVIGVSSKNVGTNAQQGEVYVFSRIGSTWAQTNQLVSSDGAPNDVFGSSVSVDTDVILVGAPGKGGVTGSAYVFTVAPQVTGVGPVFASALQAQPKSLAPGEIVSVYGSSLCPETSAAAPPLPDHLAGCRVLVDGSPISLYFGSPTQVNAVLPQTLTLGPHQLTVQRFRDSSALQVAAQSPPASFTVAAVSLSFVEWSNGTSSLLVAQYMDGALADSYRPLSAGDYIVLYLTGLGRKAQVFAEGAAPNMTAISIEVLQVSIQGVAVPVAYSGVQPGYPGFDQVVLKLPTYQLSPGMQAATLEITAPSAGQTLRYKLPSQ